MIAPILPADRDTIRSAPPRCPVCGGAAAVDRPDLSILSATCGACGWHFAPPCPDCGESPLRCQCGGEDHGGLEPCAACRGAGFQRLDDHAVEDCDACDATGLELCVVCGEAIETEADRVTYRGRSAHGWCCVATCGACAGQGCRVCGGFGGRVWSGVSAE